MEQDEGWLQHVFQMFLHARSLQADYNHESSVFTWHFH
jgi:hypothetical protein